MRLERPWRAENLRPGAVGISASRRTDVPALFGRWLLGRLADGWAEYIPAGPPRRLRVSLLPEDVTHLTFWTRWPRPFLPVLERILEAGFPVLFNVTLTGLGGTDVEPFSPTQERALAALRELSGVVGPEAIQWRYDPIFWSRRFDASHHLRCFGRLAEALAGRVDRVATSFVAVYGRRVGPDLAAWEGETGDVFRAASLGEQVELAGRLQQISQAAGIPFTVCCSPELRQALGCPRSGCNRFEWACRAAPELKGRPALRDRPTRPDCACSQEVDIGVYDTCILGCRYSYGSCNAARARRNFRRHDPRDGCLLPG